MKSFKRKMMRLDELENRLTLETRTIAQSVLASSMIRELLHFAHTVSVRDVLLLSSDLKDVDLPNVHIADA